MIDRVNGRVVLRCPDHVVLETGGVGYRLSVSAQTLKRVPAAGHDAALLSHLVLKDDALNLYGFATDEERSLFLALISVAGVGPKMALAVLSGSSAGEVRRAIATGDANRFQVVPGVGKKTAERIIVELREKMADGLEAPAAARGAGSARALAREGLLGLGYEPAEVEAMLDAAGGEEDAQAPEELIAAALRTAVSA